MHISRRAIGKRMHRRPAACAKTDGRVSGTASAAWARMKSTLDDLRYALWMRGLRTLAGGLLRGGYRLRVSGRENVPKLGGTLVVSNHVSVHDWLFVGAALERPPRFVMHQAHHGDPLLRAFFDASRVIAIAPRKQDPACLDRALEAIDGALANGELVVICPEGTMTPDGSLSPFRPGLERIVRRRPVPVVPIAVRGLFGSFFSRARGVPMSDRPRRLRAPVEVRIGRAIPPGDVDLDVVRGRIERMLGPGSEDAAGDECAARRDGISHA